jgi:hypothetical protein
MDFRQMASAGNFATGTGRMNAAGISFLLIGILIAYVVLTGRGQQSWNAFVALVKVLFNAPGGSTGTP